MKLAAGILILAAIVSAVMVFLTWAPRLPFPANGALQASFHVIVPAIIAALVAVGLLLLRWNILPHLLCYALAFFVALGVVLYSEYTQLDSPTRVASVFDVGLGVSGTVFGVTMVGVLYTIIRPSKRDS